MQAPLLGTLWAAMIIWAVRLVAIWLGSWLGAYLGGSSVEHRRRIWQGMITQVCCIACCLSKCGSEAGTDMEKGGGGGAHVWVACAWLYQRISTSCET